MKKEGRQHGNGMLPWSPRFAPCTYANKLSDSPPAAGLLLRVSPKPSPTKCGRPRSSVGKAKAKGTQKHRSRDVVVSNYRFTTWRLADCGPGFKFSGLSATGILDRLAAADYMDYDYDYDYESDGVHDEFCGLDYIQPGLVVDLDFVPSTSSVENDAEDYGGDAVDDDAMSFCEVGFVWEQVEGDEGWCLVEEM